MRTANPWKYGEHKAQDSDNQRALSKFQFLCDCPCGCLKVDYSDGPVAPGWTDLTNNMHLCSHCRFHSSTHPLR